MSNDEDNPNILYHYTSIDAFKSIIESKKIRATRYDQMNDFSEVKLGIDKLLDTIKNYETNPDFSDFKEYLIKVFEEFKKQILNIYILSFSSVQDSLEQWRAYTQNGGVAIGFDRKMVNQGFVTKPMKDIDQNQIKQFKMPSLSNQLLKCIYTEKNGYLNLDSIVKEHIFRPNSYNAMYKSDSDLVQKIFNVSLAKTIYQIICRIKHGAYYFEKEWRCINYEPNPHDYQIKINENNQWYIEIDFDPNDYIKEVWISPHGNKEAYMSIVDYYKRIKYKLDYTIENSKIPFRGS